MRKQTAAFLLALAITLSVLFGSGTIKAVDAPELPISPVAYDDSAELAELERRKQVHMSELARAKAAAAYENEVARVVKVNAEAKRKRALAAKAQLAKAIANKPKQPSRGQAYVGKAQAFTATAYTSHCAGCSGITKTGVNLRQSIYHEGKRVIAVDPRHIPLGSIVRVTLANGQSFEATAQDTGGRIKGAIIDVAHETTQEAYVFGRQSVEVRMIRKGTK